MKNLPYRPCVGIALFNDSGRVFVGERIDTPGAWQMPQGGIDAGEDVRAAAYRELREEIGTDQADYIEMMDETVTYDLPPELQGKLWGGNYRGQEQYWVAMKFTGHDKDIVLDGDDTPEFSHWKWEKLENVLKLIVPFKRDVYLKVITSFKKFSI